MNFDSKKIGSNEFFAPSKSLCIEASAGTGKTYTIQQIVARLLNDGAPLEKILIVTYTEKAAGELKDRIRKKMEEVLDDDQIDDIYDYFYETDTDRISVAMKELGDYYTEEQVRLVRLKFLSELAN